VDHEIDVVHQDPVPDPAALHVIGLAAQTPAEALLDRVGDRHRLSFRAAVADDEVVGDVAEPAKVEDYDLFRLFFSRGLDALGEFRGQRRSSLRYSPWA
jgi:hypothetical protein